MVLFLLAFAGVIAVGVGLYTLADWALNRNSTIGGGYGSDVTEL